MGFFLLHYSGVRPKEMFTLINIRQRTSGSADVVLHSAHIHGVPEGCRSDKLGTEPSSDPKGFTVTRH